jgi:hypothetical protein
MKVGDLVEIPPIKTVIQLKDLQKADLREMILQSFVVTAEVLKSLEMILASLSGQEGRGTFLKGHFGSGKSHFLSMLSLLLRHPESWEALLGQAPSLAGLRAGVASSPFLVVEVSLIQHRGSEFLEDIFLKAIGRELALRTGRPFEPGGSRQEIFQELRRVLDSHGFSKLILLVDELSEFLRSKTDAHAFQEDIRFLQYLGEEAFSFPLWIVASLQEWIEETGEINQETFNKIKDRYPLRIGLGRAHIEELISQRLIRHRPGAAEEIHRLFLALRRYFPLFPVDETRFSRLYPIHPATITLLDRLKPLFSEHRGIVDFIHYRLKGDLERGIPTFLDQPAQELLGPAAIFDHFLHRIRETAATQPFVDKVFDYYREEIPRLFLDPEQQQVALEAVKLLILLAISPVKIRYTARHLAEMILFRVTDLEADINYQFLRDILNRLIKESPYLAVIPGKEPLEDQFSVKLQPDLSALTAQKIRQKAAEVFSEDRRLFDRLLPLAESPHLPFTGWAEQRQQRVSLLWENTRRLGTIHLRPIDEIPGDEMAALAGRWQRSEEDFFIIVAPAYNLDRQYAHLRDNLLPLLREKDPDSPFLFWVPAAVSGEDEAWLKEMVAALLLSEADSDSPADPRRSLKTHLEDFLQKGRKRLGDIFIRAYFNGLLLGDDRQIELAAYGYLSQEKFLDEFIPPILARRFPKHNRIHPYLDALAPQSIQTLLNDFFATGKIQIDEQTRFGPRTILEGLLKPMGLVKKKGNQYQLYVDPRSNELVEYTLGLLAGGLRPEETIYWSLRKSPYGLLKHQYDVLLLALLFTGNIVAYQGQRRKGLDDISRGGLKGVTALGPGEILGETFRRIISEHPLIAEKWRKGVLTLPAQEQLWHEIKARRDPEMEHLKNQLQTLHWVSSFPAFQHLPWDGWRRDILDLLAQWEKIQGTLPPKEGLEKFLAGANGEPFLAEKLERLEELRSFFEEAEKLLFVSQYVGDSRLDIPPQAQYQELREEKESLLECFQAGKMAVDRETVRRILDRFQRFREHYIQAYAPAHQKARSGDQFEPYEKIRRSRRYQVLTKLNRLEMISVRHNLPSVDQLLSQVFLNQCEAPLVETLQRNPVCRCGFLLTTETRLTPAREIEAAIDLGIRETLEALAAPAYQEKLLPFLQGLADVGETEKAEAVRRVLGLSGPRSEDLLEELEQALSAPAIAGINEAFQGRVVVVNRDLDQLYGALIRRKYTLPQVHKIFREWLRDQEISSSTFVHFVGREEGDGAAAGGEKLPVFLEEYFPHLLPLLKEVGPDLFQQIMLLSLWAEGYDLAPQELLPLFSFLEQGSPEKGTLILSQLAAAAGRLREENPILFEALVEKAENEEGFLPRVRKLLEGERAAAVFVRETFFSSVLKEAFERLLSLPDPGKELAGLSPPSGRRVSPDFQSKQNRLREACKDIEALRQKGQALKRREASPPLDFQKWEVLYRQHLSPLTYLLAVFPARLERLEVSLPTAVREKLVENENRRQFFFQQFAAFYHGSLPGWESGAAKRPLMIEDLKSPGFGREGPAEQGDRILLLLDGLRWDLWEYLKEKFFASLSDRLRLVQEGALWAHFPADTPRQMVFFEGPANKKPAAGTAVWKLGGIDERVHTEKGPLEHLFRDVLQYLQLELTPRLRTLPAGTALILFSDHGFVENPRFDKTDKYRQSRYTHGEASPCEIIVPWARFLKI